ASERDSKAVSTFGLMQEYDSIEADVKKSEATKLAKEILKRMNKTSEEFSVEVLGRADINAGTTVLVNDRMTGIDAAFYVITDSHSVEAGGLHTMSLKLSKTLDISRKDYQPPSEPKKESKASKTTAPSGNASGGTAGFIKPSAGRLTSGYGRRSRGMHYGVDIAQGGTVPIKASMD